jgi:hypothetical protein
MTERKKPMPFEAFRELWQWQLMDDRELTPADLRVGIAISWYANRQTGLAWPSVATLAENVHVCTRTVIRAVECLEKRSHLRIVRRKRWSNRYQLVLKSAHVGWTSADQRQVTTVSQNGDKTLSEIGDRATSHEPLREPPILEPHSLKTAASAALSLRESSRERGENEEAEPSLKARCYRLARKLAGGRGAALVANALAIDTPEAIWDELCAVEATGEDIGYALQQYQPSGAASGYSYRR